MSLQIIGKMLGHAGAKTTQRYEHLAAEWSGEGCGGSRRWNEEYEAFVAKRRRLSTSDRR